MRSPASKKGHQNQQTVAAASKKNALQCLYKLWSAFNKNIRYIIDQKAKSVVLARFGTFTRGRGADSTKVVFIPSSELVSALNLEGSPGVP